MSVKIIHGRVRDRGRYHNAVTGIGVAATIAVATTVSVPTVAKATVAEPAVAHATVSVTSITDTEPTVANASVASAVTPPRVCSTGHRQKRSADNSGCNKCRQNLFHNITSYSVTQRIRPMVVDEYASHFGCEAEN